MSNDPLSTLGPSDSGLLDAPKTPAYLGASSRAVRPQRSEADAMPEPPPASPVDADRMEESLKSAPLPEGLLSRLHRVVDDL